MNRNKKIGDYSFCRKCRKPVSKNKVNCKDCDKKFDDLLERFFREDNGIDRAIKRLKEIEGE